MSTKLTNGKKGKTFFQQHNFWVVQLEFNKWRPLSKMIPNNLLQHSMSGKPTWLPGYMTDIIPGYLQIKLCHNQSTFVIVRYRAAYM